MSAFSLVFLVVSVQNVTLCLQSGVRCLPGGGELLSLCCSILWWRICLVSLKYDQTVCTE